MGKRDAIGTKARILSSAEKIFSEVGFDKARVDDIAKEAGVNKALIYYYFRSKDEILDTLFASLISGVKQILIKSLEDTPDTGREDNFRPFFDLYMNFMAARRKIIKVAIAESAKSSSKISVVMKLGNLISNAKIETIRKKYKNRGLFAPDDKQELLIMEFFTGIMPIFTFMLYKDEWEEFYKISEDELYDKFYEVFKKTHLAAHLAK